MNRFAFWSDLYRQLMKRDARQVLTELLVYRAQGGDERAFADLYELWSRDFSRIAFAILQNATQAEQAVQDAWVGIAKSLSKLGDPETFRPWALRILNRRCADIVRRLQRDRLQRELVSERLNHNSNPHAVSMPDERSRILEAIERLDPDSKSLLRLFYESEFSVKEIAGILEIPAGTVKSRLYKLRESLKRHLADRD